jgi:uracil-DNA glycosylase family 4
MSQPEPSDPDGPFADLLREMQACKEGKARCPSLRIRALYFEPNPTTIGDWRAGVHGVKAYPSTIDRRVMFVCESPGGQIKDYERITPPRRCWSETSQAKRFYKMRKEYGFENCYLTNSVKCGLRRGGRHTDTEINLCSRFLMRELKLVNPMVAVAMGSNAMRALRRAARQMKEPPILFQLTHYSARRGQPEQEWPHEMAELSRLLSRFRPANVVA